MSKYEPPLWNTLAKLGAKKRHYSDSFILDGFCGDFYLRFDCTLCEDDPKENTCDVLVHAVNCDDSGIRVIADAREMHVLCFLFALGISRFSEATRNAAYELNGVIRTMECK